MHLLELLQTRINNDTKLIVLTRPSSDIREKDRQMHMDLIEVIQATGVIVIQKAGIHQKVAIIDQRVVWYGSINLLSFGSSEESIMRLESVNIANELLGTLEV